MAVPLWIRGQGSGVWGTEVHKETDLFGGARGAADFWDGRRCCRVVRGGVGAGAVGCASVRRGAWLEGGAQRDMALRLTWSTCTPTSGGGRSSRG
jgi:hypothetical protein